MGDLATRSEAELRTWAWPRLRDQAVAVLEVLERTKGRYEGLAWAIEHGACTDAHAQELERTRQVCLWLVGLGRRVRAILDEAPQPRSHVVWRN